MACFKHFKQAKPTVQDKTSLSDVSLSLIRNQLNAFLPGYPLSEKLKAFLDT